LQHLRGEPGFVVALNLRNIVDVRLHHLNSLPTTEAESEFRKCCGSKNWARRIIEERPFRSVDELLRRGEIVWWSLEPGDWLEAFSSHPKIGEEKAAQAVAAETQQWSRQEQSTVRNASAEMVQALWELNRKYEEKFGYIFIVCATGKSSEEILSILQDRLNNNADTELRVAAEEQSRITKLRLEKLINQ